MVDSIVRQSRHQFGPDKDVFGPRFTKNITGTFENLCLCPIEDRVRELLLLTLCLSVFPTDLDSLCGGWGGHVHAGVCAGARHCGTCCTL